MTIRKYSISRISSSRSFEKTKTAVGSSVSKEIKIEYLVVGGGGGACICNVELGGHDAGASISGARLIAAARTPDALGGRKSHLSFPSCG